MNQDHIFIEYDGATDSIACVRTDAKGTKPLATWAVTAPLFEAFVSEMVRPFDENYVIVAYCATDLREVLTKSWGRKRELNRRWIDMRQMAWPLAMNDMIPSTTFQALCAHHDIVNPHPGTLRGDCEALVRLYWEMIKRYRTALTGEHVARGFVGSIFTDVRNLLSR